MKKDPSQIHVTDPFYYYISTLIKTCEWWRFYDICELFLRFVNSRYSETAFSELQEKLNKILTDDGMRWEFRNGIVVPRRENAIARDIDQAQRLLNRSGFEGPNAQFAKAINHMSARPKPDTENCIKDAIGAVEGVAILLVDERNGTLSKLLKSERAKENIHPTIIGALDKIYAYRGDEDGVAHAMIDPEGAGRQEAEWILGISASTIIYLASVFGPTSE
jgi:hypothetical protein